MIFGRGITKLVAIRPLFISGNGISTRFASRWFTEKHEYIDMEDKKVGRVGISNHAQEALGDVVFVQAPEVGSKVSQFAEVGAIESVKAASELLTPVSGQVIEKNEKLDEKPGLVNEDCYGQGWVFKISLDKEEELNKLMSEDEYNKFLQDNN